jgi:kinesin family member 5
MDLIETNLSTLSDVQRQLIEQNTLLKKENAITKQKLLMQIERNQVLESLLDQAQDKLVVQNHKIKELSEKLLSLTKAS